LKVQGKQISVLRAALKTPASEGGRYNIWMA